MKIEKGIPIPAGARYASLMSLAQKMEAGDSVPFSTPNKAEAMAAALRELGFKAVARKISDTEYRVWRVE